jgi:hypothetical protein
MKGMGGSFCNHTFEIVRKTDLHFASTQKKEL